MDFAAGTNYITNAVIKVLITISGLLGTSTLAMLVAIASVHDSPEMVFMFFKVGFELATFTIPALLGLSIAFVIKTITVPFLEVEEEIKSKSKWACGVISVGVVFFGFYLPTAFSQEMLQFMGTQSPPAELAKKIICSSHNTAKYKYENYTAPQIVKEHKCP